LTPDPDDFATVPNPSPSEPDDGMAALPLSAPLESVPILLAGVDRNTEDDDGELGRAKLDDEL